MSVILAPRARIRVNASWPGVSRKTISRPKAGESGLVIFTLYAPMCCVIPPASPAATSVERIASSREVLPWSTWPITVTTGERVISTMPVVSSRKPSMASFSSCSSTEITVASAPNCRATSFTSSPSSDWFTVTKTPFISSVAIRSLPRTSSFSARSLTLMPSVTVIVLVMGRGSCEICAPP